MIVQVLEQFHDYEEQDYLIDTELLDSTNPVEKLVLAAVNAHGKTPQTCGSLVVAVRINVDKERLNGNGFWDNPTYFQKAKVNQGQPQKVLKLVMFFDC